MANLDDEKATFSINVLECSVCYIIPSSTSLSLCQNGHVFCTDCREKLTQCGICKRSFEKRPISNVLQKILASVQVGCKFKSFGCTEKMNLEDRESHEKNCHFRNICTYANEGCTINLSNQDLENHEENCEYRPINCYVLCCQKSNIMTQLGFMGNVFFNHYESNHSTFPIRRKAIESPAQFELSGYYSTSGDTLITNNGKVHYIFVSDFGVDQMDDCLKACLISTSIPGEARKLKCSISMKHNGKEVINHVGKVFSIDYTKNIHSIHGGGMIYPKSFAKLMDREEITFTFNVQGVATQTRIKYKPIAPIKM